MLCALLRVLSRQAAFGAYLGCRCGKDPNAHAVDAIVLQLDAIKLIREKGFTAALPAASASASAASSSSGGGAGGADGGVAAAPAAAPLGGSALASRAPPLRSGR